MQRLASLIKERNATEKDISAIIDRPATTGHIGEFVAAEIFDVKLLDSASHKGIDGHFTSGQLTGKSVDIKCYPKNEGVLGMTLDGHPDFYLVLTGPRTAELSSRGTIRPWTIESVFLFDGPALVQQLDELGVKISVATSVRHRFWDEAEIYPSQNNLALQPTPAQRSMIEMFRDSPE